MSAVAVDLAPAERRFQRRQLAVRQRDLRRAEVFQNAPLIL